MCSLLLRGMSMVFLVLCFGFCCRLLFLCCVVVSCCRLPLLSFLVLMFSFLSSRVVLSEMVLLFLSPSFSGGHPPFSDPQNHQKSRFSDRSPRRIASNALGGGYTNPVGVPLSEARTISPGQLSGQWSQSPTIGSDRRFSGGSRVSTVSFRPASATWLLRPPPSISSCCEEH